MTGDLRLSLGEYMHSRLDCLDCVIGRPSNRAVCTVQKLVDGSGVRQGRRRPFFCSGFVPKRCDCGKR